MLEEGDPTDVKPSVKPVKRAPVKPEKDEEASSPNPSF